MKRSSNKPGKRLGSTRNEVITFPKPFRYRIDPAAFNLAGNQVDFLLFKYYSFVTQATLGFGDITPLTKIAKAFSILEAVVGQLYLVVVIAWFVGMYVSRKSSNSDN